MIMFFIRHDLVVHVVLFSLFLRHDHVVHVVHLVHVVLSSLFLRHDHVVHVVHVVLSSLFLSGLASSALGHRSS